MDDLTRESQSIRPDLTAHICTLRDEVRPALKTLTGALREQNSALAKISETVRKKFSEAAEVTVPKLADVLIRTETSYSTITATLSLLSSLSFDTMDYRHSAIRDAHPVTYDDVYEKVISPWMQSSDQVFWISGKPGSGKSTLMKYIVGHSNTRFRLRE